MENEKTKKRKIAVDDQEYKWGDEKHREEETNNEENETEL